MNDTRQIWLNHMIQMIDPILTHLSNNSLKENLPLDHPKESTYLEAFGRTLMGIAPWLETPQKDTKEEELRKHYANLARTGLNHATNPNSKDYFAFYLGADRQPLVDAAFLAQAILRAPNELWFKLDDQVKQQVIREMKKTRQIRPYKCNWLLFQAMIEAFFKYIGEAYDFIRVEYALSMHENWYLGDSVYGDGEHFHFDYYNSYVIQPMLIEITTILKDEYEDIKTFNEKVLKRAKRHAEIQERMINIDGTFPIIGRSIAYRTGAFQLLAQVAYLKQLPDSLKESQVKGALTALLERVFNTNNYDDKGFLMIGVQGKQPALGEPYISTGSLYLASAIFLVLGLPEEDSFWKCTITPWTSVKVWNGEDVDKDHSQD